MNKTKPKRDTTNWKPNRCFGRVAEEDWRELKEAAEKAGKPFSEWALEILMRAARRKGE